MTTDLERQLLSLQPGDHICPIYENLAEQMATAVLFIKHGLANGERCLYVSDDRTAEQMAEALTAGGVEVAHERERKALWLLTKGQTFLETGEFDPAKMIDFLRWTEADARAAGFAGMRLAAEATWALGPEVGNGRLIEFEARLNDFLMTSRAVVLCQYNRQRFAPAIIHDILRTHPIAILGEEVYPNPYYEPPELVLNPDAQASAAFKAKRVDWWIGQLKRARADEQGREQAESELRSRNEILQTIFDRVPVMIAFTDPQGRVLLWNHRYEEITGWSLAEAQNRDFLPELFPDPAVARRVFEFIRRPPAGWEEFPVRTKDGRTINTAWANVLLADGTSIGIGLDITERKRAEAERERLYHEVVAGRELLEIMSRRLLEAQEEERRNLARELHDEIGQILTTVNLTLEALRPRLAPADVPRLEESVQVVERAIEQVRSLSLDLRPASLDLLGLEAALRAYLGRQAAQAGLVLEFTSTVGEQRLPAALETVCFRVVQEAMTNAVRHARATHCWVELARTDGHLQVTLRDDGVGFDAAAARQRALRGEGFGLLSMMERTQLFGGEFEIDSAPGRGTTVRARFLLTDPGERERP